MEVFMRYPLYLLIPLAAIGIALASCGASSDESDNAAPDPTASDEAYEDEAPQGEPAQVEAQQDEAELMRQAAIEAGLPMPDEEIPVISDRTYRIGHMQLQVSGFFDIDASPALDTKASITSDGYTWIQFGASGEEPPNATVTVGEGDMGIGVSVGRYVATGTTIECEITIEVTPTKVSGHYSCPQVTGYNPADGSMGDVKIEVDFEATS
jgi:hypothetical protein